MCVKMINELILFVVEGREDLELIWEIDDRDRERDGVILCLITPSSFHHLNIF